MANALSVPMAAAAMPNVSPIPAGGAAGNALKSMAPAPMPSPQMSVGSNPYSPAKPQKNALLQGIGMALDGFQRGFDPQGWQAGRDQRKADGAEKAKQTLALMQQQRALPEAQRGQWWQQNAPVISEIIGQDVSAMPLDVTKFSDQALDGQIAALSAQLGIAPEKPAGPMTINNKLVDPRTGQVIGDYSDPQKPMAVNNRLVDPATGKVIGDYSDPAAPKTFNTGQAIVSIDPATNKPTVLYQDPQQSRGSTARLRPATPEEAAQYGPPGTMGQIDDTTGRFYPTARPNPQTGGLPTEGERKFGLYAKTARDALADIEKLEFSNGIDQASTFDRGGQLNPFDGNSRLYDQAIDRFLDGWSRAMTGAAMTDSEKQFYYGIMKPTFGDDEKVRQQKAQERRAMVERLKEAAARGYSEPQPEVIMPSAADVSDDELRAILGL